MFDSVKGMVEKAASGNLDPQAVEQAASQHVNQCDSGELAGHLQTAATNMQQQGQGDLAQQAIELGLAAAIESVGSERRGGRFHQKQPASTAAFRTRIFSRHTLEDRAVAKARSVRLA